MLKNLSVYFQYISSYLGVVLLGGAIVHMPVAPFRYAVIALIGILIFSINSYFELKRKRATDKEFSTAHYMVVSFFLSIGLGMLSGSIQHFLDTPMYSSILLSVGFMLSALAFYVRENPNFDWRRTFSYGFVITSITALLGAGLYTIAHSIEPHSHGLHLHKH